MYARIGEKFQMLSSTGPFNNCLSNYATNWELYCLRSTWPTHYLRIYTCVAVWHWQSETHPFIHLKQSNRSQLWLVWLSNYLDYRTLERRSMKKWNLSTKLYVLKNDNTYDDIGIASFSVTYNLYLLISSLTWSFSTFPIEASNKRYQNSRPYKFYNQLQEESFPPTSVICNWYN